MSSLHNDLMVLASVSAGASSFSSTDAVDAGSSSIVVFVVGIVVIGNVVGIVVGTVVVKSVVVASIVVETIGVDSIEA